MLCISLMAGTYPTISKEAIAQMKQGVMLINTSRGGRIDTQSDHKK